ncbi:MAG TPA: FtsX-like permease family protein [Candidatus Binataceae bacterium]|nr:FtsX-like permease family protein [Candidatus Binataceae bacterium]
MLRLLPLAIIDLWRRNRRRTILTVLAVAAATVVFSATTVIPYVMNAIVEDADRSPRLAITNRAGFDRTLPESYYWKIARVPGVLAVNRMTWFGGIYDDPTHQFPSMGIDADNPDQIWPEYALNHELVVKFKNTRDAAIVGTATMRRFGWRTGDMVSLRNPDIPLTLTFRIIGTIDQGPDLTIFLFQRDYMEEALHRPGQVSMLWVRCARLDDVSRIAAVIDAMFRNSSAETRTETEKAFMAEMVSTYGPLARIVQGIGMAAVLAIALAVLNAASMSVRERTHEVAVLKSLGFTGAQILTGLAVESGVASLAGGLIGIAAACALMDQLRGFFPTFGPLLSFGLPAPVMGGGLAIAIAVGLIAGVAPAIGTIRSSVAGALRKVA